MSDITVSNDIHTFMQSASNSAARDNLGVGDADAVNHASLVLTGTAESSQFIGPLRGEVVFRGQAAENITKGQAVYVSGISGNTPVLSLADSSNSAKMPAFGLAGSTVTTSQSLDVVTFGTLSAIDTSTFTLGATLYVNGAGSLSATKPTGESSLIQNIGKVQRVHATSGSIKVGGAGRSNDTPNLDENKIFIGNSSNAASTAAISTVITDNASSVKTAYESNSDTNAFTDSEKTKLAGIASGAEVNAVDSVNSQTGAVALDADDIDDTSTAHRFATAAQLTKLDGIETASTADQTGAEIKSLYEAESNTNAFTDAEKTKLSGIATGAEVNTVDSVNTQTGAVVLDADDISDAATTNKFTTASDISKLAGIESGADVTDATNVSAAGAPIISSGAGTPSSTPSKVGDIYIDTTSDDAYIAVGTASSSDWEKSNDGSGSGATDLSWTASTSTVSSSTGTNATLTNADSSNAGLMSSSDKTKLDGIEAGATADQDLSSYQLQPSEGAFVNGDKTKLDGIAAGAEVNAVDSVNTQTGSVVLDADDISDSTTTNKFTTASDISKLASIESGADVTDAANVDAAGATMNTDTDISGNSWVVDEDNMASNDATKVPTQQSVKAYIDTVVDGNATSIQGTNVDSSVATPSDGDILVYRSAGSDFVLEAKPAAGTNPAAADITDATADGIALITSSDANPFTDADESKLDGIAAGAEVNTVDSVNAQTGVVVLDADDISDATTTNKFTTASDISKLAGIEAGATADQTGAEIKAAYESEANTNAFTDSEKTKLAGIAAGAEVNTVDSVNTQTGAVVLDADDIDDTSTSHKFVTASDLSTLSNTSGTNTGDQDLSSYQLQPSEGAFQDGDKTKLDGISAGAEVNAVDSVNTQTGAVVLDADDISDAATTNKFTTAADISKLAGIEAGATADQTAAEIKTAYESNANTNAYTDAEKTKLAGIASGAEVNTVDSVNTQTGAVVLDADDISDTATTNKFTTAADISKLAGIEAGADVTDTANVQAAGALMDSEVDADIKTLSLPASTTISTFGASLVDDVDAATARTTLGVDAAGTDNSTDVTLAGTGTYISIAGQVITVDPITESDISDLGTYLTAESDTLDSVTGRGATTTNAITVGSIDINGEIIELAVNTTSVTGSTALDPANGTIQRLTFSGNVTFTDSLANGESITLHIDDGTAYTATWPTMEWVGGSAPTLDTTNETIIVIWKVNSTLYGMSSGVSS